MTIDWTDYTDDQTNGRWAEPCAMIRIDLRYDACTGKVAGELRVDGALTDKWWRETIRDAQRQAKLLLRRGR